MGTLQEQLKRLKDAGRDSGKDVKATRSAAPAPEPDADESWKVGVNPLAKGADGKRQLDSLTRIEVMDARRPTGRSAKGSSEVFFHGASSANRADTAIPSRAAVKVGRNGQVVGADSVVSGPVQHLGRLLGLTDTSHFRRPERWIESGQHLQPPGGGTGPFRAVHVGVDFGTAYTKVAVRFMNQMIPVPWDGLCASPAKYFLPGEISRRAAGTILIGRAPDAEEVWSGIKQPFLTGNPRTIDQAAAAAFLAWVLRYVRAWLYREYGRIFVGKRVAWNLAIGCPTGAIEHNQLAERYLHLASAAWLLSRSPQPFGIESAQLALQIARPDPDSAQLDSLGVVPEFVAQVAGYAGSSQRQAGLHFLMDVGAGTLDLAMFNVERDMTDGTRDHYPILEQAVDPYGTHFWMDARRRRVGPFEWNDASTVPSTEKLCGVLPLRRNEIQAVDAEFCDAVKKRIRRVIAITRGQRSPLSPVWQLGLPIFLSGGGSHCALYRDALDAACRDYNVKPLLSRLIISDEAKAVALTEDVRHRLSVAFGLTSDSSLYARITPSQDIPNFVLFAKRNLPDRDDLYGH